MTRCAAVLVLIVVTAWAASTPRPAQQAVFSPASGRTGQPDDHPGARTVRLTRGLGRITPSPSPTRTRPAATTKPRTAQRREPGAILRGVASFMAPAYGAGYLALPAGPGHRVTICGPAACVTRTSNDAGPDLAMQRRGRVADLSFRDFATVCGCNPWVVGLVRVTVTP